MITVPPVRASIIRVPQPDGAVLVKAGKVEVGDQMIGCKQAASLLGLSQRCIEQQCRDGLFKTAFKPGGRPHSSWRISIAEVLARRSFQGC